MNGQALLDSLNEQEMILLGRWIGNVIALLLDDADVADISAVLAQQIVIDLRDITHPHRTVPTLARHVNI